MVKLDGPVEDSLQVFIQYLELISLLACRAQLSRRPLALKLVKSSTNLTEKLITLITLATVNRNL